MPREEDRKPYPRDHGNLEKQRQTTLNNLESKDEQELHIDFY